MNEIKQADISQSRLVEFFSPYCAHCKRFAPTLQTFYELYYTSDPSLSTADAKKSDTFSTYYNFNFGKVNCAAFGTACSDHEVKNFPTIHVLKDGKLFKKSVGGKPLDEMTEWMEEVLEEIKPGTRPKGGLPLPKVGDDHVDADAPKASSKKKSKGKDTAKGEASDKKSKAEDVLPDDSDSKSKTKDKKKSGKKVPNSEGRSVALTAETFNTKVSGTRDPWFIKFYAPWCPHCQHMAPAWKSVGRDMEGKLNVGEVNCEVEKRFCKDVGIRGFPSLLYFQGGERMEYEGLRKVGDLLDFANKAVSAGGGVNDVSAAEFEELEKTEEVIFTYMYDHATTSEDFAALERLALPLIGRAKLVKTNDPKMFKRFKISTWPRLVVSRDGKPTYYTPLSPRDMRDKEKVLGWMHKNWQPIVPEITSANAEEIMAGKLVVLGILSRDRADEFVIAKREIKNAALEWIDKQTQAFQLERQELRDAKQLRIEEAEDRDDQRALRNAKGIRINMEDIERRQVQFAWVDGVFWERWIKVTYGISVKDGERVIVNDEEVRYPPTCQCDFNQERPLLTMTSPEPPLLGHNNHRQPHRPFPHLHPRDLTQDRRQPAQTQPQIHGLLLRAHLLLLPPRLPQTPFPHVRIAGAARGGGGAVRPRQQEQDGVPSRQGRFDVECRHGEERLGHDGGVLPVAFEWRREGR